MKRSSKEKVIRAAVKVFSRKGYDGASMREIAQAARLTKPMIYYHFRNKKDLYLYILESQLEEFHSRLQHVLAFPQDHRAVLGRLIDLYDETFRANPAIFFLIQRETTGNGRFVEYLTEKYFSPMQLQLARFFKQGALHGVFRSSLNYDLCSLTLTAVLMFHFSQGRVIQQLSKTIDSRIAKTETIHAHIMSLFTLNT
jgi:AcrR family transcriptional regulator